MTTLSQYHLHYGRPARKILWILHWTEKTHQFFSGDAPSITTGKLPCGENWRILLCWISFSFFAADGDEIFTGAVGAEASGKAPWSVMLSSQMHKSLRVPNGVFQIPHLGLRQRKVPSMGRRMPENTNRLKHFGAFCCCASWPPSECTTLKNTV